MSFGGLKEILHPFLWGVLQAAASVGSHLQRQLRCFAFHLRSFCKAFVAVIAVSHVLITMEQLGGWAEVVYFGGNGDNRVD
jgi:hypothetical protein